MARNDPFRNFRYRVDINGVQTGFSEVSGFDIQIDPIDYREGDMATHVLKLPGLNKYGNVTLKWGVTLDSKALHDWHKGVVDGKIERKEVLITLIDEAGNDAAQWSIVEAWPNKYTPTTMNAKGNEVAIETLELCNEGIERVK